MEITLRDAMTLVIAVAMPFILFILQGIRTDIKTLFKSLDDHLQSDAELSRSVAVLLDRDNRNGR